MKSFKLFVYGMTSLMAVSLMVGCGGGSGGSSEGSSTSASGETSQSSQSSQSTSTSSQTSTSSGTSTSSSTSHGTSSSQSSGYDSEVVKRYMENLAKTSEEDHLYVHYYRFNPTPIEYNAWDIWAWPYKPKEGEGYRFDWKGRTTSADRMSATGDATIDELNYATVDIDLTVPQLDGGWSASKKKMGGTPTNFYADADMTTLDEQIGIQIVQSQSRSSSSGFWKNDGGNLYVKLEDYALLNNDKTTSYHVFLTQDYVQQPGTTPPTAPVEDPFENDDGTKVTYGNKAYENADWNDKPLAATSPAFLSGTGEGILPYGAGVGYQIMVASFSDSDGDGFGDIYGIEQKLDYLENLGVNVLWLTPIQLSDSYHGYDISDYLTVDPKFGSKVSPAATKNNGVVDSNTAKADYKSLIDAAHARGMAVVMDLVINHTSTTNTWFIKSAQLDEALRGYYQWGNNQTQAAQINEDKFWYPYGSHVYSFYAKFGSSMPELNYAYADTRAAVETMALNWCAFGVDGFRMDAVKHIFLDEEVTRSSGDTVVLDISTNEITGKQQDYSSNLTKNLNFWRELNASVKAKYPNAFFVGENFDGHAYHVAPYYEGFDSLFDFYSYFNLTSVASSAYRNGQTGAYTAWLASFLGAYDGSATPDQMYSADKDTNLAGAKQMKYGGVWSLNGVLNANNQYRTGGKKASDSEGFAAIDGCFTSNHDIARAINRIAGQVWTASGLEEQGEVTTANYNDLDSLATLVEITELMLPGCTWIYYGDELGMTGNLQGKSEADGYVDLVYRQPMKWKQGGQAGDGSNTCGYSISGSGASVNWDNINSTETVKDAETQVKTEGSHYDIISQFAKAKGTTPALIKGNYKVTAIEAGAQTGQYGVVIDRTLGSSKYKYFVNFGNSDLTIYDQPLSSIKARSAVLTDASGNVIAQYGGSGGGVIPEGSKYKIIVGDETYDTIHNETPLDPSYDEWYVTGVSAKAGDEMLAYDNTTGASWTIQNLDSASKGWKMEAGKIVCQEDGVYDFYLKFKYNADQVYIGYHQ